MPLKINRRCKVCQVIETGDNELLKRIYHCAKFRTDGESLRTIHRDYENVFGYQSLMKHAAVHQAIKTSDLKRSLQKEITEKGANAAANEIITHGNVRELVMQRGYKGIKSGKIKLKASDVIKAAKDQADYESKLGDQALTAAELMMRIASGEIKPIGEQNGQIIGGSAQRPAFAPSTSTSADPAISS